MQPIGHDPSRLLSNPYRDLTADSCCRATISVMLDSGEGSLAAATAIAIILVFVVVAIVGDWVLTFRIS